MDTQLEPGLLPIHINYAAPATATDSILQLYIIPVVQVADEYYNGGKNHTYQLTYKCDCCGLFSAAGGCCLPYETCGFRANCTLPAPPPPPVRIFTV